MEKDQYDQARLNMGLHPKHFSWQLGPGQCFEALLSLVLTEKESNDAQRYVKAEGLKPDAWYKNRWY